MVDAVVTAAVRVAEDTPRVLSDGRVCSFCISPATPAVLKEYARLAATHLWSPAQSPEWIEAWASAAGRDIFIASLMTDDERVVALGLEVVEAGGVRLARFPGGCHANGNFPAVRRNADPPSPATLHWFLRKIGQVRPDIDAICLERQAFWRAGDCNPLAALPHDESPDIALAVDLSGGFDAVLDRHTVRRKRKKHRARIRKFEAAGGFRLIEAKTPEEVDRLLSAFFTMKAERFARQGITDVFADPSVRAAMRRLYRNALSEKLQSFLLNGLEVGGVLRAVAGFSRVGERIVCDFCAIAEDELARASPGDFLFFESIAAAATDGLAVFDFSVGDEPYKRLWCDIEERQFDLFVPFTARGRLHVVMRRLTALARRMVKRNATLASALRRARRTLRGSNRDEESVHV
jgi:CelD/BcsL family acetyltransferase involved in cellulose biosynthesis